MSTATARASVIVVQAGALRMKRSPDVARVSAYSTRSTDSVSDMRKRVIRGSVTVSGRPRRICPMKWGITDPRDAMTFP